MRLLDKVALITGGGHNIGAEMCRLFAREGAGVAVNDVVEERAEAIAREIIGAGGNAISVIADVSAPSEAWRFLQGGSPC